MLNACSTGAATSVSDPSAEAAARNCVTWRYSKPTPAWVSARAVALLAEYHAVPGSHHLGDYIYEWGQDGRLYRYFYTMHPADPQNPVEHPGVEASYCEVPRIMKPQPARSNGLVTVALVGAAVGLAVILSRRG